MLTNILTQPLSLTSLVVVLSILANTISHQISQLFRKGGLLAQGDQISRSVLLAYALGVLLPNTVHDFGLTKLLIIVSVASASIRLIEYIFQKACQGRYLAHKPWFFYICLLPHCALEGFSINTFQSQANITLLGMFLIHKFSEISMVTLSTQIHLTKLWQQRMVQGIFISATPLAMILSSQVSFSSYFHEFHPIIDLINLIALIHLALFCKLCQCEHQTKKAKPLWFGFSTLVLSFIFFNSPNGHVHTHDHDHGTHHHKPHGHESHRHHEHGNHHHKPHGHESHHHHEHGTHHHKPHGHESHHHHEHNLKHHQSHSHEKHHHKHQHHHSTPNTHVHRHSE